jgi:D-arginine dehydrogenase
MSKSLADHFCDILVIGGGIAGASIAAHLSEHAKVHVLEMEDQPGYHSTGRSAALFLETHGNSTVRALSKASRAFLFSPPAAFCSVPLVKPRPVLVFGHSDQQATFDKFVQTETSGGGLEVVTPAQALELCPILRSEGLLGGAVDRRAADIEVHELHDGYLRTLKRRGGGLTTGVKVTGIFKQSGDWFVESDKSRFRAGIVVNAAGAWADELGQIAGTQKIGLEPRRRTAALIEPAQTVASENWPIILDVEERFYAKPDAGLLLLSPIDETLTVPCDAQPEELDIAIAIERLESATILEVRRIHAKWAGLRSFVRDRSPVVGFDREQPGFFWMAALGGYGIQTAPALSAMAASLVLGRSAGDALEDFAVHSDDISPARLR